jgi:hypothetical protein
MHSGITEQVHVMVQYGGPVSTEELFNLLCGAGNFSKIWSACQQHEIQYTKRRMNKCMHNYTHIFTSLS